MTVAELIEELKTMPQDAEVVDGEQRTPHPEFYAANSCSDAVVIL